MKSTLSLLFLFITFLLGAQNIDSLELELSTHPNDSNKVRLLSRLSYEVRPYDQEGALEYAYQGLVLSGELKYKTGQIMHYLNICDVLIEKQDYRQADSLLDIAALICNDVNDLEGLAGIYYNKSLIFSDTGAFEKAIEQCIAAIQIYDETENIKMIGACNEQIGLIYEYMDNPEMAVSYYKRALEFFQDSDVMRGVSSSYLNIAGNYFSSGALDTALNYYQKGYEVARNIPAKRLMAWNITGMANVNAQTNRIELAEIQYGESLELFADIEDRFSIAGVYHSLGEMHFNRGNLNESLQYYEMSLQISRDIGYKNLIRDNGVKIAEIFEDRGDYRKALQFFTEMKIINDSLLNESNIRAIADMEAKYQNQEKQKQIELQTLELDKKAIQNSLLVGGVVTLGIIILFLGIIYRQSLKTKNLEKKQMEFQYEKEKQAMQLKTKERAFKAFIEGQEGERKRIAEDLHDGLGGTLASIKHKIQISESVGHKVRLKEPIDLLDKACISLRNISHNLMPPQFQTESLRSMLESHFEEIHNMGQMKVYFHFSGDENLALPDQLKINIYRIIQELVHNAFKHAEAERLDIQVLLLDDHINLMVEDDGRGFDPESATHGIGLTNVRSRLEMIEGEMEIDSKTGRGTIVNFNIPLRHLS